jgi:hypothetical protein
VLTLRVIEELADRIERAYLRRQPYWHQGCSNPRVWAAAAVALLRLNRNDPRIPIDPELYVASQPISHSLADPWEDLTQSRSVRRYRRRVRQLIRNLRGELVAELRFVRSRVQRGETIEDVLYSKSRSLSPLGRFIAAYRAGRPDLMERFRATAQDQHGCCPLYRPASQRLLPSAAYPVQDTLPGWLFSGRSGSKIPQFSLN